MRDLSRRLLSLFSGKPAEFNAPLPVHSVGNPRTRLDALSKAPARADAVCFHAALS